MKKIFCDAGDEREAKFVGSHGDDVFVMCQPCSKTFIEDEPLGVVFETFPEGPKSIPARFVEPGDVIVRPAEVDSENGPRESDADIYYAFITDVIKRSDSWVGAYVGNFFDSGREGLPDLTMKSDQSITIVAHSRGFGS